MKENSRSKDENLEFFDEYKESLDDYEDVDLNEDKVKKGKSRKKTKKSFTYYMKDPKYTDYIYKFIFKFYLILLVQQLVTFLFSFICLQLACLYNFIIKSYLVFLFIFIISMCLSLGAFIFKEFYRNKSYSNKILIIFSVLYAYSATFISLSIDKYTLMMSTLSICLILVSLLLYTFSANKDIRLSMTLCIIVGCGIFHYFFYFLFMKAVQARIVFSTIWILICGFYLVGWTRHFITKAVKYQRGDDYILCTFKFYIIILFFLSLFYAMKYQYLSFFDYIYNN